MPAYALAAVERLDIAVELMTGLSVLSAASLWLWVYLLSQAAPELCGEAARTGLHCPLCYPAALATLLAIGGAVRMFQRRLAE